MLAAGDQSQERRAPCFHWTCSPRLGLLDAGVLAGAAAPLLFLAGLRRIGATQTAVLSLCEPLAATLLAAVMFGQLLAPSQLLGGALLLGAGIAVQTVLARPAPVRPPPASPAGRPRNPVDLQAGGPSYIRCRSR